MKKRRLNCKRKRVLREPLLKELCEKRIMVIKYVKEQRAKKKRKNWSKYDYPSCIVACRSRLDPLNVFAERSSRTLITHYDGTKILEPLLKKQSYGEKNGPEGNRIGYCAEQRIAATILTPPTETTINDLEFSPAVRPRTSKIIPYCSNCKSIFPQL